MELSYWLDAARALKRAFLGKTRVSLREGETFVVAYNTRGWKEECERPEGFSLLAAFGGGAETGARGVATREVGDGR
jgi:hypothetical protein